MSLALSPKAPYSGLYCSCFISTTFIFPCRNWTFIYLLMTLICFMATKTSNHLCRQPCLSWIGRSLRLVECPRSLVSRHFFGPYLCKMDYSIDIQIFDNYTQISMTSERKDYIKYLGILLNSNLSWKYHAGYIASKISKAVGIIARLRHYVPLIIIIITPYLHHLHITFLVHFFPFSVYYVLLLFIA